MTDATYMRDYRVKCAVGSGPIVACACGCGQTFHTFDGYNKRPRRYVRGHNQPRARRGVCGCGCGRAGKLTQGLVSLCYNRLWRSKHPRTALPRQQRVASPCVLCGDTHYARGLCHRHYRQDRRRRRARAPRYGTTALG